MSNRLPYRILEIADKFNSLFLFWTKPISKKLSFKFSISYIFSVGYYQTGGHIAPEEYVTQSLKIP